MTPGQVQDLCKEQLEWCEVLHQLVPTAAVQVAFSERRACVYVTAGVPRKKGEPPPHRYLYRVSDEVLHDEPVFAAAVKDAADWWNALTEKERLERAEQRLSNRWTKEKLLRRLKDKGFHIGKGS